MTIGRPYHEERDLAAVTRMWREVGWIDDTEDQAAGLRDFLGAGAAIVADVGGEAECLVHRVTGSVRHGVTDLPLSAITAVTTSHVGRRQGLASVLMSQAIADAAREGAAVATLGIFDQGFYDRFGFGTGTYEHRLTFDPATLAVEIPARPPVRLGRGHTGEMHACLLRRHRGHGSVVLDPPVTISAEMAWTENPVALGYRAPDGRLTHFVLGSMKGEHGPYVVDVLAYEQPPQLLELLGLLRSLGDQVDLVTVTDEPAGVQLQDLIRTPFRQRRSARLTGGSGALHEAIAEQQDRILDLRRCIGAVRSRREVGFGLRLRDPLESRTEDGWQGISGEYTVRLGERSTVEDGLTEDLSVLDASVGPFTRLWFGVRPASGLALTDDLHGDPDLVAALDEVFLLPPPRAGWSY